MKEVMSKPPVLIKMEGFTGLSPKRKESATELIKRIASICKQKRIRPNEFFHDHDKLRKGILPRPKFVSAIDQMKMDLDETQVALLADNYTDPSKPDLVRHKDFSEEIES